VDLGGVIVTPREEDFYKITKEHVVEMFDEICLSVEDLEMVLERLLTN
ncbi:MAG: DUF4922 domain-containing protein, partial [Marinilabiliaceae bacterium]|nr:DUF4922 domain-containing protein [Marinilabiliaceae bacterium]